MLTVFLITVAALDHTGSRRPVPRANPNAACREPDGRIRLGCLPAGTLRALPSAKAAGKNLKKGSGPHRQQKQLP
jgi:hypothetical protein